MGKIGKGNGKGKRKLPKSPAASEPASSKRGTPVPSPIPSSSNLSRSNLSKGKRQLLDEIEAARSNLDFDALRAISAKPEGFVNNDARQDAWLCALGLTRDQAEADASEWLTPGPDISNPNDHVIQADRNRSANFWDMHQQLRMGQRQKRRNQMANVIYGVSRKHPRLQYYQGFSDICLVFIEVFDNLNVAFHAAERFALFFLSDFMCRPFNESITPLCFAIQTLMQQVRLYFMKFLNFKN
jgi:hypothetical protein